MKVAICKRFDFDAAHLLPNVPAGHKCGHLHGHTYVVELVLEGELDPRAGWFCDYAEIGAAWAPLHAALDHKYLNDIPGLDNPTTEVLAPWIARKLGDAGAMRFLRRVRVYESSSTWCEVSVEDARGAP